MSREQDPELQALDRQIAALEKKRALRQAVLEMPWPKRVTLAVHRAKEANYDKGQQLGLTGQALDDFAYTGYEVLLEYMVQQDGSAILWAVDGKPILVPEEKTV